MTAATSECVYANLRYSRGALLNQEGVPHICAADGWQRQNT